MWCDSRDGLSTASRGMRNDVAITIVLWAIMKNVKILVSTA